METLLRASALHTPGTIAFVTDEETLLMRVRIGWQYLSVRNQRDFLRPLVIQLLLTFSQLGSLVQTPPDFAPVCILFQFYFSEQFNNLSIFFVYRRQVLRI